MAGKLAAVYHGRSRRLIVSVPPRHLKSHLASVAFPAWCLGHDTSAHPEREPPAMLEQIRRTLGE
jgi:hypothetical protein